ncbi:hypothetical protein VaNZ11_012209 [Volvox africanus]|uniref:Calcineurin-like phosphoesterase domain-containing protein n=1 Tax=Volvox africanus TaxID=51714 RepID=A0ABQ5SDJ8_9CHLO|nr:hypothetical protein VaNZ11_012209 [Volvox africanus]
MQQMQQTQQTCPSRSALSALNPEVLARLATLAPVYAVRGNVDDNVDDADTDIEQRYGPKSVEPQRDGGAGAGGGGGGLRDVGEAGVKAGDELDGVSAERTVGNGGRDGGHRGGEFDFGGHGLPNHRLLEVAGWRVLVTHILGQPPHAVEPDAANLIARYEPQIVVFGHSHKHLALTHGSRRFYNPGSAGPARFKFPRTAAILVLPSREDSSGRPTMKLTIMKFISRSKQYLQYQTDPQYVSTFAPLTAYPTRDLKSIGRLSDAVRSYDISTYLSM